MTDVVLYGLDEQGAVAAAERVSVHHSRIAEVARSRLAKFQRVEAWAGPVKVLELERPGLTPARRKRGPVRRG